MKTANGIKALSGIINFDSGKPVFRGLIICLIILIFSLGLIISIPLEALASEELYLTILHTNDEHSALIPHSPAVDYHPFRENPTVGGYARLSTAVKAIREEKIAAGEPLLLLSAGDNIGGSPFSWLIPEGEAFELTLMQMIGYDATVIGNHEFDYGPDILAGYYKKAGYPDAHDRTLILSSNTIAPPGHPLKAEGLYRSHEIITLSNGLRVGIFGLIGNEAISYTTANGPVAFADPEEAANIAVSELKASGADLIIALTHSGIDEDRQLAQMVEEIDIIVGGHSHTIIEEPEIVNNTFIVHAGTLLQYLGRIEIAYNPETGEVRDRLAGSGKDYLIQLDHNYPADPEIEILVQEYKEVLDLYLAEQMGNQFDDVIKPIMFSPYTLTNEPPLRESPFGNFVADAMRIVTSEAIGHPVDFAIQANGAIRGSLVPGAMPHSYGAVSPNDLSELVGLGIGPDRKAGYSIAVVYLTGAEIRRALEVAVLLSETMGDTFFLQFSGLRYNYNPENAVLFTLPFLNLPIPSTRAVTLAERYTGDGRQSDDPELYVPIEWDDQELYCLVTDSYILSFLPMVGDMVPSLALELKDDKGNIVPEDQLDQLTVQAEEGDLKVWHTVLAYAASQPVGQSGLPEIDSYYATTAGRINIVSAIPHVFWIILGGAVFLVITTLIVRIIRSSRKRKQKLLQ